jgi:peroxiredoxin
LITALAVVAALLWLLLIGIGFRLCLRLLGLHGRMLMQIEELESLIGSTPPGFSAPAVAVPAPVPQSRPSPPPVQPLTAGAPAPDFELPTVQGGRASLAQYRGRQILLVFFEPTCNFGTRLLPDLLFCSQDGLDGRPMPVVVTAGDFEQNRRLFVDNGFVTPVLHDATGEVATAYGIDGTPTGYVVDGTGHLATGLLVGVDALTEAGRPERRGREPALGRPLAAGETAPVLLVPRIGGGELTLDRYRGQRLLLVFSDPYCAPCLSLAPALEALQKQSSEVEVLMVSRGGEEATRELIASQELSFEVGLQRHWEVSRDYRTLGTPAAFLIDETGAIAAEPAVGLTGVRSLLATLQ